MLVKKDPMSITMLDIIYEGFDTNPKYISCETDKNRVTFVDLDIKPRREFEESGISIVVSPTPFGDDVGCVSCDCVLFDVLDGIKLEMNSMHHFFTFKKNLLFFKFKI